MPPVISVVGKSRSGKTTLIEKLVSELKRRKYRIGIIKHAHHAFEMDKRGKDSWRHKQAGADTVIVATQGRIGMVKDMDPDTLDDIIPLVGDMDLIITEGYKRENKTKIEIFRSAAHKKPLCRGNSSLAALVTDADIDLGVPRFGLEDIQGLADFIESRFLKQAVPATQNEITNDKKTNDK